MRNIVVDNVTWRYKIGRGYLVAQQPASRQKVLIQLHRLLGYVNIKDWERDVVNHSYYACVTPRIVADFIKHHNWYCTAPIEDIFDMRYKDRKYEAVYYCDLCREYHDDDR